MNIRGKILELRAIEESDLPVLHRWANDPETQDSIGAIHFPSSMDFHRAWFAKLKDDSLNQRFAVEAPELGLVGISSIINIDWRNNHAWHGVVLGEPKARRKGYGIDAIMATMRYAFDELHLERLDGSMIEYNALSHATYCGKRLGWKDEGRRRNYYFRRGRYWDQLLVGITRQDYADLIARTNYWAAEDEVSK